MYMTFLCFLTDVLLDVMVLSKTWQCLAEHKGVMLVERDLDSHQLLVKLGL